MDQFRTVDISKDEDAVQAVNLLDQNPTNGVEGIDFPQLGEFGNALARKLGMSRAVEEEHPVPAHLGKGGDDAEIRPHLVPRGAILKPCDDL